MLWIAELIFWALLAALVATYLIYPISVAILSTVCRRSHVKADITPSVTLVISAYNEADVIREKIENALALDYPRDKLEILVISDASTDGTDEIVSSYRDRGVVLCRQPTRGGKSRGLTTFVPHARGEILVFSDANSIYEPEALRHLVRHFADPNLGYVVGGQRYSDRYECAVTDSEALYMKYETALKRCESSLSSVVGGDGAIYALRASLFEPLRDDDISDLVNPLQVVARGYRGVFESKAVCWENTARNFRGEFRRKVRIVNRSLRGLSRVPSVLNPLRVGWFAYEIWLHKAIRWFAPFFLVGLFATSSFLAVQGMEFYWWATLCQSAFYAVAFLRVIPGIGELKLVYVPYYFCMVNLAAAVGVLSCLSGYRFITWSPERSADAPEIAPPVQAKPVAYFAILGALLVVAIGLMVWFANPLLVPARAHLLLVAAWVYWVVLSMLLYSYLGYWACLRTVAWLQNRGTRSLLTLWFNRDPNGGSATRDSSSDSAAESTDGTLSRELPLNDEMPIDRQPPRPRELSWPSVTIIIPAYNEASVIEAKLQNASGLDYAADLLEIVVASDGSTDETVQIAERYERPNLKVLAFPLRRGKAAVLNEAVSASTGDVLCFCDANVLFGPDALQNLIRRLQDAEVGAVTGDVQLASDQSDFGQGEKVYYQLERRLQCSESMTGSVMGVDGGMYVLRRELYHPLPVDTILDDFEISMHVIRQGRRIEYEPEAVATENGTSSAWQEFRRRVRVSAGAVQSLKRCQWPPLRRPIELWQYMSHKLLRWLTPGLLLLFGVSNYMLWWAGIFYQVTFVAQLLVYFTASVAALSVSFRRTKLGGVIFYFVMSHVAMAVGIFKGLLDWQEVTWVKSDRTAYAESPEPSAAA